MDMIIRHARLKKRPGTWDIGITGDRITTQPVEKVDMSHSEFLR